MGDGYIMRRVFIIVTILNNLIFPMETDTWDL